MSLTAKQIIAIMEKAKELGINELKVEGMNLSFADQLKRIGFKASDAVPEMKPEDIVKPLSALDEYSDEEIKFYATPRFDEIQAEKEAHKQKLKEEGRA